MANDKYLKDKIYEVCCLYKYDLLKDFMKDDYRKNDYLYNFYTSCVERIEKHKMARSIFELLWEWSNNNLDKVPDVMNSFNTYMDKMVDSIIDNDVYDDGLMNEAFKNFKEILDAPKARISQQTILYFIRNGKIKEMMEKNLGEIMKKMDELSKWTNTIGNFVLLPKIKDLEFDSKRKEPSENKYKNAKFHDRMDIYLDYLKNCYSEKAFRKYINENYLWDYVDKKYNVIPLINKSDTKEIDKNLPNDPECYITLAEDIIKKIKRRGMFMEIMIRLNIESAKQFVQVNKTENASSYAKVIEEIEKMNLSDDLKNFIKEFQRGIV